MNLFRSEEHVRNWRGFKAGTEGGILALADLGKVFSHDVFTRRLDPDYISGRKDYRADFLALLAEMGKRNPFWLPPAF